MKTMSIATIFLLLQLSIQAHAAPAKDIIVYATEKSHGSISSDIKSVYTITFEITLVNISGHSIDLSAYCLKSYTPTPYNNGYKIISVDDTLSSGLLKNEGSAIGITVLSYDTSEYHHPPILTLSDKCN